ncbi:MAG: helix-turn-helix transcriptional regulator [Candidatus Nephthysia bennettiae]|uniref:Response regulator transcription factor n=1 Tax=Candidatus Nephthysia bennettiae TaxID=3127016 RepID=A0A934JX49_9BACT|nr:response regulator transcription factor [Candidatus Dormibacteraeota bacterium]MBJ7610782.1 response regulator transcription factor [Candidatus Dormibacteraeota bacterium]PZR87460.1 MAG: helix-turn-helix transcriptional regulator [Candidatus Dormibacteraeota bacterium]
MIAELCTLREQLRVSIVSGDQISRDGIASQFRASEGIDMVSEVQPGVIALLVTDQVDEESVKEIRTLRRSGVEQVVVVATRVDDSGLLAAVEAGASGLLRRSEVGRESLVRAIEAAAVGEGCLAPDLLGRLLHQVGTVQRQVLHSRGLNFSGLTDREIKVLKLLAEGYDTNEVGRTLFHSERTVKNILHDVTSRLHLRNRTHAVAYALRQGLI